MKSSLKKILGLLVLVVGVILLAGCNKNEVTCSATMEEDGVSMKGIIVGQFDSADKLKDAVVSYEFGDSTVSGVSIELEEEESIAGHDDFVIYVSGMDKSVCKTMSNTIGGTPLLNLLDCESQGRHRHLRLCCRQTLRGSDHRGQRQHHRSRRHCCVLHPRRLRPPRERHPSAGKRYGR